MQSLDTTGFFQIADLGTGERETTKDLRKRLHHSISNAMHEIDEAYRLMDETEKLEGFKRKEKLDSIFK